MLTGNEQRALEHARRLERARRKDANRARYLRHMRRIDPRWGLGVSRAADPYLELLMYGGVLVRRQDVVDRPEFYS